MSNRTDSRNWHPITASSDDELAMLTPWINPENQLPRNASVAGWTFGRPFQFDALLMHLANLIMSRSFLIIADIGYGKSAWMKKFILMSRLFAGDGSGLRIGIDDLKWSGEDNKIHHGGEYAGVANYLLSEEVRLRDAHINILHPDLGMEVDDQVEMLKVLSLHMRGGGHGDQLDVYETTALETVLEALRQLPEARRNMISLVQMLNAEPEMGFEGIDLWPRIGGQPQRIGDGVYESVTADLADSLRGLTRGTYQDMFNGTDSPVPMLSQPVVAFDYSGMTQDAMSLFQELVWFMKASATARGDERMMINISVHDESHALWGIPSFARAMAHYIKTIRSTKTILFLLTQHIGDFEATGSPYAINSLNDLAGIFVGHLGLDEANAVAKKFGLNRRVRDKIMNLTRGQFILLIPGHQPVFFEFGLNDLERSLTETNFARDQLLGRQTNDTNSLGLEV